MGFSEHREGQRTRATVTLSGQTVWSTLPEKMRVILRSRWVNRIKSLNKINCDAGLICVNTLILILGKIFDLLRNEWGCSTFALSSLTVPKMQPAMTTPRWKHGVMKGLRRSLLSVTHRPVSTKSEAFSGTANSHLACVSPKRGDENQPPHHRRARNSFNEVWFRLHVSGGSHARSPKTVVFD